MARVTCLDRLRIRKNTLFKKTKRINDYVKNAQKRKMNRILHENRLSHDERNGKKDLESERYESLWYILSNLKIRPCLVYFEGESMRIFAERTMTTLSQSNCLILYHLSKSSLSVSAVLHDCMNIIRILIIVIKK